MVLDIKLESGKADFEILGNASSNPLEKKLSEIAANLIQKTLVEVLEAEGLDPKVREIKDE